MVREYRFSSLRAFIMLWSEGCTFMILWSTLVVSWSGSSCPVHITIVKELGVRVGGRGCWDVPCHRDQHLIWIVRGGLRRLSWEREGWGKASKCERKGESRGREGVLGCVIRCLMMCEKVCDMMQEDRRLMRKVLGWSRTEQADKRRASRTTKNEEKKIEGRNTVC